MFGKTRDINDATLESSSLDTSAIEDILGDEAAASSAADVSELRRRVEQVEAQISSQFTSLATYAQIAQEQVELARSEARAQTERSEQRLTSLIERERADRVTSTTGAPVGSAPDVAARLDALERSVALLKQGLDDCRQQQKALAMAITTMFERFAPVKASAPAPAATSTSLPSPTTESAPAGSDPFAPPTAAPVAVERPAHDPSGPIPGLALNG